MGGQPLTSVVGGSHLAKLQCRNLNERLVRVPPAVDGLSFTTGEDVTAFLDGVLGVPTIDSQSR